jgi:HSP20 family molecular chaperone IbpA
MSEQNVTENTQASAGEEATLIPAVDIFEDAQGITLKADLPGVSRDRLSIQVDKDTLSIEGDVQIDIPDGTEPLYADLRATHFRRSFTLSQELEADRISAQLNDGELTLHVPKRAEVQPRKIEVKVS